MTDLFYLDNGLKKGEIKNLEKFKDKPMWIDMSKVTKEERAIINKTFNIHPLTAEDLISHTVRIKVEQFDEYLFCVFYGIYKKKSVKLMEIDFVLGKNFLITNHKSPLSSLEAMKNRPEIIETSLKKGVDFFFHKILDQEIDNYFPVLEKIDDDIEKIEEEVTWNPRPELLSRILTMKRGISYIKKHVFAQREKLSFLAKNDYKYISKKARIYFRDVYDHSIRVSDTIDNYREAVSNTFDAYMSSVSNKMSDVMKTLSIIATIALPLTVISGIYGTNFDVLPGQHGPFGFWIMIIIMLLVIGVMLYYFKKKNWF